MAVSLGLIGCAHIHVPGFVKMLKPRSDVVIKSVWDTDATRGQKWADDLDARYFSDYRTILSDGEIGGVIVCTETVRHIDVVPDIAKAKKPVFVEKPLGFSSQDATTMAAAINAAGVMFQTGYFMRSSPIAQFLKQQVDAGVFGKITRVRGSNCHEGAMAGWFDTEYRWMTDPALSGCGAFGDLGTHVLDLLLWMFGEVTAATATLDNGTNRFGCDEVGEGLLRFKSGAIGTIAAGWDDLANPATLQISGTEAFAAVIHGQLFFKCPKIDGADGKTPWTKLPPGRARTRSSCS